MEISIVIPTANRSILLERAVQSVLRSIDRPTEIVIVDDGTQDEKSFNLIESMKQSSSLRFAYIKTEGHTGPSAARNLGVKQSRGDVILFLDDDDELIPDYITQVKTVIENNPTIDFGFANYLVVNQQSQTTPKINNLKRISGPIPRHIKNFISGLGCGFWIKKHAFEKMEGLDENIRTGEDIDLCVRLYANHYSGWYEENPGVIIHRHHPTNMGASNITLSIDSSTKIRNSLEIYRKNAKLFEPLSTERWFLIERYIRRSVKSGFYKQTAVDLKKLNPDPIIIIGLLYWLIKILFSKRY